MKTTSKIMFKHIGMALGAYWVVILMITGFYQRTTEVTGTAAIVAAIFTGHLILAVREAYQKGKQDAEENSDKKTYVTKTNS
ncbi:MAG: hypothetical protein ACO36I_14460 [Candidatus Latescibacterota bacterium]|jgi:hypothetical protein